MHRLITLLAQPTTLRRTALASIVANVVIVVTGGAVRLTGSGLGCPTWPRCTDDSYTATAEMGINAAIEFGNRTITFAVGIVAAVGLASALGQRPRRRRVVTLAVLVLLGIPAQAVLGGITVLTDLNPWVVGGHFLVSMAVIACAYAFWRATGETDGIVLATVAGPLRTLAAVITAVSAAVLVVGTFVTGSGPHAGDAGAKRTGLDPEMISQVHADVVFLLLGLSVAAWFAFRAAAADAPARRAARLLVIIAAQGAVGFVQYATDLPAILVGVHIAGACAVWLATLDLLYATHMYATRMRVTAPGLAASPFLAGSSLPARSSLPVDLSIASATPATPTPLPPPLPLPTSAPAPTAPTAPTPTRSRPCPCHDHGDLDAPIMTGGS